MVDQKTNLVKQMPYRKRLKVGDVFVLKYPCNRHVFGRIMKLDVCAGGFPGCIKLHIYSFISDISEPPKGLVTHPLLVGPIFVNKLGFSRGYMPVIANIEVKSEDNADGACYLDGWPTPHYVDETGRPTQETDLKGAWGLGNYRTLDAVVSKALGIPVINDE